MISRSNCHRLPLLLLPKPTVVPYSPAWRKTNIRPTICPHRRPRLATLCNGSGKEATSSRTEKSLLIWGPCALARISRRARRFRHRVPRRNWRGMEILVDLLGTPRFRSPGLDGSSTLLLLPRTSCASIMVLLIRLRSPPDHLQKLSNIFAKFWRKWVWTSRPKVNINIDASVQRRERVVEQLGWALARLEVEVGWQQSRWWDQRHLMA